MNYYFVPYHIVKDKIQSFIEANKDDFKRTYGDVNVDYSYFEAMSLAGRAYIALIVDKDVEGFAGFVINENASHKGLEAENVVFYLSEQIRGKKFKELIKFSQNELKKIDVPKITATIKSDLLAKLLKINGFVKQYEIWEIDVE